MDSDKYLPLSDMIQQLIGKRLCTSCLELYEEIEGRKTRWCVECHNKMRETNE